MHSGATLVGILLIAFAGAVRLWHGPMSFSRRWTRSCPPPLEPERSRHPVPPVADEDEIELDLEDPSDVG